MHNESSVKTLGRFWPTPKADTKAGATRPGKGHPRGLQLHHAVHLLTPTSTNSTEKTTMASTSSRAASPANPTPSASREAQKYGS